VKRSYIRIALAALAAVALLVPAVAQAKRHAPRHGKQHAPKVKRNPVVSYVFRGTLSTVDATAGTVVVSVKGVNHHGRELKGQDVAFDVSSARIVIRDVNHDGKRNLADAATGDKVQVLARLPRRGPVEQPIKAKGMVDKGQRHTAPKPEPQPEAGSGTESVS
jgi:hypothetical protein